MSVKIDFHKQIGTLNPDLHSSNFATIVSSRRIFDSHDLFKSMHFTAARTHDWALVNSGQRMVDVHNIFPLMHLDADDERNYVWGPTDEAIRLCYDAGTKIMYRLGTSIEHTGNEIHFNTIPPQDFDKYADVCAHIIRHYTRGWSNGFHYDIKGWEIWNEPELHVCMWQGSDELFAKFFATVLKRLKTEFPDQIIGGPAHCCLEETLLPGIKAECDKLGVEPDFYSFHRYGRELDDILSLPGKARRCLDALGWKNTKISINEWHFLRTWEGLHKNVNQEKFKRAIEGADGVIGINSAAFNICTICGWHDTPLDEAYYYGCGDGYWGFRTLFKGLNKNYYSMVLLGNLFSRFSRRVAVEGCTATQRALAAISDDGKEGALLIGDFCGPDMSINIELEASCPNAKITSCLALDNIRDNQECDCSFDENGVLHLAKSEPGSAAFWVTFSL